MMLALHSPGVNAEGGLGDPKEPKGAHEQQDGPIQRAQEPPAVPTIQVGSKGEAEAGLGAGLGLGQPLGCRVLPPPLPSHAPCTLPTSP